MAQGQWDLEEVSAQCFAPMVLSTDTGITLRAALHRRIVFDKAIGEIVVSASISPILLEPVYAGLCTVRDLII